MNFKKHEMAYRLAIDSMNDYCSSRLLIKNEYTLNSLQLGCTAIEKLLKSFLCLQSESNLIFDHNPEKIYKKNKEIFDAYFCFNLNFLKWLGRVYDSRYTSNYGSRKEIMFGEKHFLAELDHAFFQIFSWYKISNAEFSDAYFNSHRLEIRNHENYIAKNIDRKTFTSGEQKVFCFQLFNSNSYDYTIQIKAFNPEKPFIIRDSRSKDGNILLDLDVGFVNV